MVEFSRSEERVIDFFRENQEQEISLDTISDVFYREKHRPIHWRNATAVFMRMLIEKINMSGRMTIIRTTPMGSGYKAKYVAKENKDADFPSLS